MTSTCSAGSPGTSTGVYAMPACTSSLGEGTVDAVVATLRFASGAVGVVEFNWVMNRRSGLAGDYRLAVFGTRGAGYVEMRDPVTRVYSHGGTRWLRTHGLFDVGGTMAGSVAVEDRHFWAGYGAAMIGPCLCRTPGRRYRLRWRWDESARSGEPVHVSR